MFDIAILPPPAPRQQDLAVSFFFNYLTIAARSLESSQGFLEYICPVFIIEGHSSVLAAAVKAAAARLWVRLRPNSISKSEQQQLTYRAVVCLQRAINGSDQSSHDATVLAALALQLRDTLSALFFQQKATGSHRDGALALLSQQDDSVKDTRLLANLLHYKVSLAVRQGRALPSTALDWLHTRVIPALPNSPSCHLDVIGVSVARLQQAFSDFHSADSDILSAQLLDDISAVEYQLDLWLEVVPQHWCPRRLQAGESSEGRLYMYHDACDIYPSVQPVTIWNAWRIYRLIMCSIKAQLGMSQHDQQRNNHQVKHLVNEICHSVPFYLGNLNYPILLLLIDDATLIFPSYHDLPQTSHEFREYQASDHYVSKADHVRHLALQGPFHIMNLLMHLAGLIAGNDTVPPEQKKWVSMQLLRSLYLLRVIPRYLTGEDSSSESAGTNMADAVALVTSLKERLWTVHVL